MTVLALAVYVVYLLAAFVARTLLHVVRIRDSGWRGVSGRTGSAEWWAGVLFVVALLLGLGGLVAGLLGLGPIAILDHDGIRTAGLVVAVVGVVLTVTAQMRMGEDWRIGVDESEQTGLVTSGLFGAVRNPIFTAMFSTGLGLTLMVPNGVAIAGLVALGVALQLQVRVVEEPHLRRTHGAAYVSYEAAVGRFLPGLGLRPSR